MLKRLRSNKGFSTVMTSVIVIVVMLLAFGIFEVIRINIRVAAIRDKYEDAIIHVSVSNYAKLYQNVREGQAASYSNTGGYVWRESHTATKAQIMQYMNNAMSNGEIAQCTIKNITFSVTPAPRAPGDTSTAEKFSVEGTIEVEKPYDFAWSSLAPMRYTLEVKSEWKAKF